MRFSKETRGDIAYRIITAHSLGVLRRVEVRRGPGHAYAYPGWTGLDWTRDCRRRGPSDPRRGRGRHSLGGNDVTSTPAQTLVRWGRRLPQAPKTHLHNRILHPVLGGKGTSGFCLARSHTTHRPPQSWNRKKRKANKRQPPPPPPSRSAKCQRDRPSESESVTEPRRCQHLPSPSLLFTSRGLSCLHMVYSGPRYTPSNPLRPALGRPTSKSLHLASHRRRKQVRMDEKSHRRFSGTPSHPRGAARPSFSLLSHLTKRELRILQKGPGVSFSVSGWTLWDTRRMGYHPPSAVTGKR